MTNDYDDIINLPHHVSKRHQQMSMWSRAAQFAPFSALTGYDDAIHSALPLADEGTQENFSQKDEICYEEESEPII
jgi:hypothetical protein